MRVNSINRDLTQILRDNIDRLQQRAVKSSFDLAGPDACTWEHAIAADGLWARELLGAVPADELESVLMTTMMRAEAILTDLRQTLAVAREVVDTLSGSTD